MFGDIRRMRSGQLGQPWRPPLHSNRLRHGRRWQMTKLSEIGGRRLPFLRWSAWRMMLGARHLTRHWQVGDGREEALAAHVTNHAREGDIDDVIRTIDDFCYRRSVMMNVGDEKGEILDRAIREARPQRLLELGNYCG